MYAKLETTRDSEFEEKIFHDDSKLEIIIIINN